MSVVSTEIRACEVCHGHSILMCSGCTDMYYCSVECQSADWLEHSRKCSYNGGLYSIKKIPECGYGAVAIRDIPKGTVIIQDSANTNTRLKWFNHSCNPTANRSIVDASGNIYVIALYDIRAGEEITVTYTSTNYFSKARRDIDIAKFGFVCKCSVCILADPIIESVRKAYETVLESIRCATYNPDDLLLEFINMMTLVAAITNSEDTEPINMAAYLVFSAYIKRLLETNSTDRKIIKRMLISSVCIAEILHYTDVIVYKQHRAFLESFLKQSKTA